MVQKKRQVKFLQSFEIKPFSKVLLTFKGEDLQMLICTLAFLRIILRHLEFALTNSKNLRTIEIMENLFIFQCS